MTFELQTERLQEGSKLFLKITEFNMYGMIGRGVEST